MKKNYFIITIMYLTNLLIADYPNFEVTINNNPYPEKLILHSMSNNDPHLGILNDDLSLYWGVNNGNTGFDLKVINNHLSYYDKTHKFWIITDTMMTEVDTLRCANDIRTDYHEILILDNGGYILQGYDSTWVDMSQIIDGGYYNALIRDILIIQEFDSNDSLIFEWDAANYLDISNYNDYLPLTSPIITWMHGNSIEIDNDNNLLLSNRTNNEIFKIDRNSGEIIWTMGGPSNEFTFINDPLGGFNKQHDVRRIDNGNITLFDNGTQHSPMISRALEYEVDELNKTATLVWDYNYPETLVSMSMGSVQRLPNNNTLISWGFFFESIILNAGSLVTEVDYEKNVVLEIKYPVGYYNYRARKSNWNFSVNTIPGDVNLDNIINVIDIINIINHILEYQGINNVFHYHKMDLNTDNDINILDIIEMIDIITEI